MLKEPAVGGVRLSNLIGDVRQIAGQLNEINFSQDSPGDQDLKQLVPLEISKVRQQISKFDSEIEVLNQFTQSLEEDLYAGVNTGECARAIEFRSNIDTESRGLELEIAQIKQQRDGYKRSLQLLLEVQSGLQLNQSVQEKFSHYLRSRISLRQPPQRQNNRQVVRE